MGGGSGFGREIAPPFNMPSLAKARASMPPQDRISDFGAQAARIEPAMHMRRKGHPGRGDGLALETEVMTMWLWPLGITPEVRKTRKGWQATFRVTLML
jgi:hypothetical protein